MSVAMRWSIVVAGEAMLTLSMLTFGNPYTNWIELHRLHLAILAVLGGIGWLVILLRPSRLPTLLIVAPLPLLASLVITSTWSAYPSLSWYATWQCAAYIGIAWLLAIQASHPIGRRNLVAAMGIVAAVFIPVYLATVALAWVEWVQLGFPIASLPLRPLGDGGLVQIPTWVGDVIALSTPVVVVWLWLMHARVAAAVFGGIALFATFISGTRATLLPIVVLSVIGAVLLVRVRASRRVAAAAAIAVGAVLVVGIGVILLSGRSFDEGRSSSFASAIEQFTVSPLTGTGPGTYAVMRMSDTVDVLAGLAYPDANNVILTTAGESGVVGLAGLGLTIAAYAIAIRSSWRREQIGRPVVVAALFGLAVFAGHAMADATFILIGAVLLMIANVSLASTPGVLAVESRGSRSRSLDAVLVAGLVVIVVGSVFVARNEFTLDAIASADRNVANAPGSALESARRATAGSPETVPAWWVRMLAADASGDHADAVASARKIVGLEGFGQEWLSLAVLEAHNGDRAAALDALSQSTAHPPGDPMVLLNAAIMLDELGDPESAADAARRLLLLQPDIGAIAANAPPRIATLLGTVRGSAAAESLAAGDPKTAFVIALYGDDHRLAQSLAERLAATDPSTAASWATVTAAWFGDRGARATLDAEALRHPTVDNLQQSWRLAIRACDASAINRWARAVELATGYHPALPVDLGVTPAFQARQLPNRYPGVVWRMDYPTRPYVHGIWSFALGNPACSVTPAG